MNKKYVNAAVALLFCLAGCQSGSNSQPGISSAEHTSNTTVNNLNRYAEDAESDLVTTNQALKDAQAALLEAKNAKTEQAALAAKTKAENALVKANEALASTDSDVSSASSLSTKEGYSREESQKNVKRISEIQKEIQKIIADIQGVISDFDSAVNNAKNLENAEKEKVKLAQLFTELENISTQVSAQNTLVNNIYAQKAENAQNSEQALSALSEAKLNAQKVQELADKANQLVNQAGNVNSLSEEKNKIEHLVAQFNQTLNNIQNKARNLLMAELNISETEAGNIVNGLSDVSSAKVMTAEEFNKIQALNTSLSSAKNIAVSATNATAANVEVERLKNAVADAKASLNKIEANAKQAHAAALVVSSVAEDANQIQKSLDDAKRLVAELENNLSGATTARDTRIARDKESTTNNAYSDPRSIVQEYLDKAKREELIDAVKAKGTDISTCGSNAKQACSNKYPGAKKGDLLRQYSQAYSSYAVLREEFSEKVNPSNAYMALVKEEDLVKDKSLVPLDAQYKGKTSFSQANNVMVTTYDFELNVKNNKVNGAAYTVNSKKERVDYILLESADVSVRNGAVGFNGIADFEKLKKGKGTYQGVFAGSKAEEVVGTFENNVKEAKDAIQGAFAGKCDSGCNK